MDVNVRAFRVVQQATSTGASDGASLADKKKREASRRGGLKGGISRAQSLSHERRVEIAKRASKARWKKPTP